MSIRPIRPDDEPKMVQFHATLSDDSVFYRYAGLMKLDTRVAHQRLARICTLDGDREMALVAEQAGEIVAVGRLMRLHGTRDAEFAVVVSDRVQGQGLGRELVTRLLEVGRSWGLERIVAQIAPENSRMRSICRRLGFTFNERTGASRTL